MKRKLSFALLLAALLLALLVPTASAAGGIWGIAYVRGGKNWVPCVGCQVLIMEARWQDPHYTCYAITNYVGAYICPAPVQTQYMWGFANGVGPNAPWATGYFWASGSPAWTRKDWFLLYGGGY